MRISEILRLVMINLLENRFKVILTSLGIIVGSATIVLVIAIGNGGQADVAAQFKNLSAGTIDISVSSSSSSQGGGFMQGMMPPGAFSGGRSSSSARSSAMLSMKRMQLTEDDAAMLLENIPQLSATSLIASGSSDVDGGSLEESKSITAVGVSPEYAQICNLELLIGDFISSFDCENKSRYAVIGYSLATEIFGTPYAAYNEQISLGGKNFTVCGVLNQMGSVSSGINPDSAVYVPYSTGVKYIFGSNVSPSISALCADVNDVSDAIVQAKSILELNYADASFTISDAGSKMEAAKQSATTLSTLLFAVATIVFIVGGIGIMNVLFVSVKERTKEIGILKALGCSKREILMEFLIESNAISVFGGIVGMALSAALMPVVSLFGISVLPTAQAYIMALIFAVVTGTLFGFYPAKNAAALLPVEALSQE